MSTSGRKQYGSALKVKVALEAIKAERTAAELASRYGVHVSQITRWKQQVIESLPEVFSNRRATQRAEAERLQAELYRQIGQLKVELDWLKKKLGVDD
jgi:transposase-like protein